MNKIINAKDLLGTLGSSPEKFHEIIQPTRELFISNHQILLDEYVRISGKSGKGIAEYSKYLLMARCINDLTSGFYLATHGYIPQGYSTLKPVLESIDLITLFTEQPDNAEVWADGGKKAWEKLKPNEVRKKLGRDGYDALYGHFCEAGGHPTFASGHGMAGVEFKDLRPTVHIVIGGAHSDYFEPHLTFLLSFCFFIQLLMLHNWLKCTALNTYDKDRPKALAKVIGNFKSFVQLSEPYLANKGLDVSEISKLLITAKKLIEEEQLPQDQE